MSGIAGLFHGITVGDVLLAAVLLLLIGKVIK